MADASLRLLRAYLGRSQEPIVGALPQEPKLDMPLPAGAELVGSVSHRHPPMVTAYIDSELEPSEIVAFYEREYDGRGWRPQLPNMPQMQMSGFMAAGGGQPPPHMRVFCKGESEPYYRLEVLPDQPRIRLSWHAMSQGVVHPCSTQPMHPGMHGPSPDVIPRLEGPADVPIRGGGGGGSSDEWSTYGSAHTAMPAAELMDHFAGSISEQGHELIERGSGDRVAWAQWRMKKKGWEGFLIVAEQRPDVRHLTFISYTEGAIENLRNWQTFSSGWSSRRVGG